MPLFRSPARAPDGEGHDLTTPEELRSRKRRRNLFIGALLLIAFLAVGWFAGRPIGRGIKSWQARRAAAEAERLIDAGSWQEAQGKVQDACQLRITEPAVIRVAARFLTGAGHFGEAGEFWKQLEATRPLTPAEQRDFATAELGLGNLGGAAERLRHSRPEGSEGTPEDWRIAMQLAARQALTVKALEFARKIVGSPASTPRQRLEGVSLLLGSAAPADRDVGWETIQKLAYSGAGSPESLDALVSLAQRAGSAVHASSPDDKVSPPVEELAARLEAHPLARVQHWLLALDLRLILDLSKRAETIATAIARFGGGDNPENLAGLGAWLYSKGEFAKALQVIPESKAVLSRTLFLQYLDTLGALRRWHDIEDLIQRQKFTLEPLTEQMYLARCSDMQGQTQARDVHWNAALAAAGKDVPKLVSLGKYAVRNGALGPAEMAYRAAIEADPKTSAAYVALLDLFQTQSRTAAMHELLVAMAKQWPEEDAVRNDCAYTGLLLNLDPAAAREEARALSLKAPNSLPHRTTLALAELRLGHALSALDAFQGEAVVPSNSQPRQSAVYAAALWETSNEPESRRVVAAIPQNKLLPEEKALIEMITPE